jgi:hypothetical protein
MTHGVLLRMALLMFLACAHATSAGSSATQCQGAFVRALADSRLAETRQTSNSNASMPKDSFPRSGKSGGADCERHPWLRQVRLWTEKGMSLEAAMLIATHKHDINTHPQFQGDLVDIARMVAAHTLVQAGHIQEADKLWLQLTLERQEWAEPWFNLGLSHWTRLERSLARQSFEEARKRCQQAACNISPALLNQWLQQTADPQ